MSWGHANKLEAQLQREVQALLKRAEQADAEDEPEIDIPDELARREDRLAAIEKAKAEIERRAQARFEAEQAEYEEKLKQRKEKEDKSGKKARGRAPKPPEAGPRDKDQVNLRTKNRASCRHRKGLFKPIMHRAPSILSPI